MWTRQPSWLFCHTSHPVIISNKFLELRHFSAWFLMGHGHGAVMIWPGLLTDWPLLVPNGLYSFILLRASFSALFPIYWQSCTSDTSWSFKVSCLQNHKFWSPKHSVAAAIDANQAWWPGSEKGVFARNSCLFWLQWQATFPLEPYLGIFPALLTPFWTSICQHGFH